MKKKEIMYSCYSTRIILLIGETEEIENFVLKLLKKKCSSMSENRKREVENSLSRFRSPKIRGMLLKGIKDFNRDENILISVVKTDYSSVKKLKRKLQEENLYRIAFHENRHAVDRLVIMNSMHFEDLENTARIQADLDLEFVLLVNQYLKEKEV